MAGLPVSVVDRAREQVLALMFGWQPSGAPTRAVFTESVDHAFLSGLCLFGVLARGFECALGKRC
jgi:hypothetical protein